MKDISGFIQSLDADEFADEFKENALFALEDYPATEKQKEILGAMSFSMAMNMIEKYHEWVNSDLDET